MARERLALSLREELQILIAKHKADVNANTPDFILVGLLEDTLASFARTMKLRDEWYAAKHPKSTITPRKGDNA